MENLDIQFDNYEVPDLNNAKIDNTDVRIGDTRFGDLASPQLKKYTQ